MAWSTAKINQLPNSSFLYVEPGDDEDGRRVLRTLRHLPYRDAEGGINLPHLRNAISRLGQPATGKGWLTASLRKKLLSRGRRLLVQYGKSSFSITKQSDDRYRWFAIFTNKYRDDDNPPEILSEAAHLDFIKAVTDGEWPYPEVWLHHVPGSRFGVADLLAYDRSSGFSLATGLVDSDKGLVVEALNSIAAPLAVSHGMPIAEIRRDESDPTILTRYRSKEISPLLFAAAANKLTDWVLLGENDMKLEPKEAEEKLQGMFGAEWFEKLKDVLSLKSQKATEEGLEYKEEDNGDSEEAQETEAKPDDKADEETSEEKDSAPPITRQEIADAIAQVSTQFKSILDQTQVQLDTLTATIAELKQTDEKKIAEKAAWTSGPSISEIVRASVIGDSDARVDGRTKAAKDGPKQAKVSDPIVYTGNPTLDDAITSIVGGNVPTGGD